MNRLTSILIFILSLNNVKAQNNIVNNPSFEENNICPNYISNALNFGHIINCSNPSIGTPDYYNSCYQNFPFAGSGVPQNVGGYQFAKSGVAYVGFGLWINNVSAVEYIQMKFSESLKSNHHYTFECYLSRANKVRYAVSNFGAYFSNDSVSMPTVDILPFTPQINNPAGNYFTDTLNWMPFTGTYLAQGGEKYVILGNFNPASQPIDTLYQYYGDASYSNWAYYYIDDVSLIDLDSALTVKENEAKAQVEVFPNPATGVLNVKLYAPYLQYHIADLKGTTLIQNYIGNQTQIQIDIDELPRGFYVINLINKQGYITREKFVKL